MSEELVQADGITNENRTPVKVAVLREVVLEDDKSIDNSQIEANVADASGDVFDTVRVRGRIRICKQCRFSCTDARIFYNHQRTAHAEGRESEESVQTLPARRISTRQKKLHIGSINNTVNEVKCLDSAGTGDNKSSSLLTKNLKYVGASRSGDKISHETDEKANLAESKTPGISSAKFLSKDAALSMLDTNRSSVDSSFDIFDSMSVNYSEDENDLGEEGGRLIIDDSTSANGNSSVTPTRCGNIQNRTYVCRVCDYSSTSAKCYLRHLREEHHFDITIFECDICDYATKYKQKLPRHRKLHFSGTDLQQDGDQMSDDMPTSNSSNQVSLGPLHIDGMSGTSDGDMSPPISLSEGDKLPPVVLDDGDDDEESSGTPPPPNEIIEVPDLVEKKKKTRQEVDPAKYFEVCDDSGMKYACANCGNIYKWRKSLNKHWKEKHNGEDPDSKKVPKGMVALLATSNYTVCESRRRVYHNVLLKKMTVGELEVDSAGRLKDCGSDDPQASRGSTPLNFLNASYSTSTNHADSSHDTHVQNNFMPNVIGPFITHTNQPVFPTKQIANLSASLNGPIPSTSALDLSRHSSPSDETDGVQHPASGIQNEPLDFSVRREESSTACLPRVKLEADWNEKSDDVPAMDMSGLGEGIMHDDTPSTQTETSGHKNSILQCKVCSFQAKTVVDYSSHMTVHLNKKAYKCAQCETHFEQLTLLNEHFSTKHINVITSHKEAIQKIPHGLQQTYHLLKMPISSIPNLSSQDAVAHEPKQLKCNLCDFVAKWPAELQKHAVSHSEERPFMCMVCGSTYKWKWDMVKHFEKAHDILPNPYKRRDNAAPSIGVKDESAHLVSDHPKEIEELEPLAKRRRRASGSTTPELTLAQDNSVSYSQEDSSVAGILAITQAANRMVSKQPNFLDDVMPDHSKPVSTDSMDFMEQSLDSSDLDMKISNNHSQLHLDMYREGSKRSEDFEADTSPSRNNESDDGIHPVGEKTHKAIVCTIKNRQTCKVLNHVIHSTKPGEGIEPPLPYKCIRCEYRARWPSEITQHMKNHSDEKPYLCPRCTYRSKWKWDVVKHMKRCGGGGTIKDVIDTSGNKKHRGAPPNALVMPEGHLTPTTPQPTQHSNSAMTVLVTSSDGKPKSTVVVGKDIHIPAAASEASNPINGQSLLSASPNPSPPVRPPQQFVRSLIMEGQHHCLMCPFVGNSPAELRRHTAVHSEEKPFACGSCGYLTRWKCDLKKHMKNYNHIRYADDSSSDSLNGDSKESGPMKCHHCNFETFSAQELSAHVMQHTGIPPPNNMLAGRFKCKVCPFAINDLATYLQHRKSHQDQRADGRSPDPPVLDSSKNDDQDEARLKHPRKPMRKLVCSKCNFVCSKREAMANHEAEHEEAELAKISCFYCESRFLSKDALLDHISSHPEFNPIEWETFFLDEDVDMEDVNNNSGTNKISGNQMQSKVHADASFLADTLDLTLSSSTNLTSTPLSALKTRKFECEWCTATFAHVATLYQHARNLHPLELRDQEASETPGVQNMPSQNQKMMQINKLNSSSSVNNISTPSSLSVNNISSSASLLSTIHGNVPVVNSTPRANGQLLGITSQLAKIGGVAILPTSSLASELGEAYKKTGFFPSSDEPKVGHETPMNLSADVAKSLQLFQCTKCPYTAPSAAAYLRHIEQHGSKNNHTCWYCDFSVPRLSILYKHMRSIHADQWRASVSVKNEQEVIALVAQESLRYALQDDADDVSLPQSRQELGKHSSVNPAKHSLQPVIRKRSVPSYQGVPLQPISADGRRMYKCALCYYINSNASAVASHSKMKHGLVQKYQCGLCTYSVDNLKLINHHGATTHPNQRLIIDIIDMQEINTDRDMSQEIQAMKNILHRQEIEEASKNRGKILQCSRCPFMVTSPENLHQHMLIHSMNPKYRCGKCDYSTDTPSHLVLHAAVHDSQHHSLPSSELDDIEMKASDGDQAMDLSHTDTAVESPGEIAASDITTKARITQSKALDLSQELNDAERPVSELFKQVLHKYKTNGRMRYKCSKCPYYTFCRNNIIKHRGQHLVSSRFRCRFCNYSATRAFLLKQHERFHLEENKATSSSSSQSKVFQDFVLDPYDPESALPPPNLGEDGEEENEEEDVSADEEVNELLTGKYVRQPKPSKEQINSEKDQAAEQMADKEAKEILEAEAANTQATDCSLTEKQFRIFKCSDCPFTSSSSVEFRKHWCFHNTESRYKCDYCTFSVEDLNSMTQHRKLHDHEPDFNPSPPLTKVTNPAYTSVSDLGTSSAATSPSSANADKTEALLSCSFCPYKTNQHKAFAIHSSMHGLKRKYICDYCDWSADRLSLLYQHRKVHTNEIGFSATPMDSIFLNHEFAEDVPGEFEAKILDVGISKEVGKGESFGVDTKACSNQSPPFKLSITKKTYVCPHCPFVTGNRSSFDYHTSLHSGTGKFACKQCSYRVDRWNLMCQHQHLHQQPEESRSESPAGKRRLKCPRCPYHGPNQQLLDQHMEMHGGKVSRDDDARGKVMDEDDSHHKTMATTTEGVKGLSCTREVKEMELRCQRCPYIAKSKQEITFHMQQHAGHGTVACPYCDFTCTDKDILLTHVQVHFPCNSIDQDTLNQMINNQKKEPSLSKYKKTDKVELSKTIVSPPVTVATVEKDVSKVVNSPSTEQKTVKEPGQKTKVYVCQYCEREFEGKAQMIQHERQHLC